MSDSGDKAQDAQRELNREREFFEVSETEVAICKHCGEQITFNTEYDEWVHSQSDDPEGFAGEPLCHFAGMPFSWRIKEAAAGRGIYAEPLSVVGAKLPEGLCGVTSRNGEHCVFTPHEGKHSWQRK